MKFSVQGGSAELAGALVSREVPLDSKICVSYRYVVNFSIADLAAAGGLPKANAQKVAEAGLLALAYGNIAAADLKRMAVVGAFTNAGVPLLMAGRIAEALEETEFANGFPSGKNGLDRDARRASVEYPVDDELAFFAAIAPHPDIYWPHRPLANDARIEIVDGAHLFHLAGLLSFSPVVATTPDGSAAYIGKIVGGRRGAPAKIKCFFDFGASDPAIAPERLHKIRDRATSRLIINLSLAIRAGLWRVGVRRGLIKEGAA
jgi:hypothetical protein